MADMPGPEDAGRLNREGGVLADKFAVKISVTPETVTELLRRFDLDVGDRPHEPRPPDHDRLVPADRALLVSGTHAREWGGPDILINLAADLLEAWSAGTGLVYGGTSFTAAEVRAILERVELIVFPDINPDGREYSQTVYAMWRKNRNAASSGGDPNKIGVDDNRNYDFLWDYPVYFDPAAVNNGTLASTNPGSDLFHGTAPFSEAETKNVSWLFDNYPRIRRFIDIHSYGGNILHPWGDDANQSMTASNNFTNPAWNGKRGLDGDAYAEYIMAGDLTAIQTAGSAMKAAIAGVRGESCNVAQSFRPGRARIVMHDRWNSERPDLPLPERPD